MDSFEDLEDLSRLGQVDDALHRYMTEAEQLTTSADPRLSRGMEFAPFASSLGNFDLQPTSSQPASTEHTQSSSGDSRNLVKGPQASSKSQRRPKGRPPETDNKAMGPWVVSNRRVQKRYRERQKVRPATTSCHQAKCWVQYYSQWIKQLSGVLVAGRKRV